MEGTKAREGGRAQRFVRDPNVLWRRTGHEVLVLATPTSKSVMQLAGPKARLWAALAEPIDYATATSALAGVAAESGVAASSRVAGVLGVWLMLGLIQECE